jgi:apolipoprotein N-acyltransferase
MNWRAELTRRRLGVAGVALGAGACLGLAFPPVGWWPLMPVGLAVFGWLTAVRPVRLRAAAGLGYLTGLGFFLVLIPWLLATEVWASYFLLVAIMACWYALLGLVLRLVGRLPGWPLYGAAAWVVVEFADSRWPLGGFPWGRLSYAAAGTPIEGWLPVVSASGVSFLIALTALALTAMARHVAQARRRGPLFDVDSPFQLIETWGSVIAGWAAVASVAAAGWGLTLWQPAAGEETVTVGVIQGNVPGTGLDAIGVARTTTHNSLAETIALMAQVGVGQQAAPDFVLWPETSIDMDPEQDALTAQLIGYASDIARAPILVGGLERRPDEGVRFTLAAWWSEDDVITSRYHKKNIVPFGEWIPARGFFEPLFPELRLVGLQTIPGEGPGVVAGVLADGRAIPVGVLICFEVGYDDTMDELIQGGAGLPGARLVTVQTNNSALTGTGQMAQQDAITRIRAMEARRDIVVATTNSLAGWITPDGASQWQAELRHSASASVTVPLRDNVTFAVAHRRAIEVTLVAGPAVVLGLVLVFRRPRQVEGSG